MARHWITYSVSEDRRRRRRGWGWRWRWPWNWPWPRRNRARVVRINRPRRTSDDERRRRWPWLLLLLPLFLLLVIGGYLLMDDSEEETVATNPGGSSGALDPSAGSGGGPGLAASGAGLAVGGDPSADNDAGVTLSIPDAPSIRLKGDTTFMDLGDISCQQEQRFVLMSDGAAHAIENLDDKTMAVLAESDVPINTVAMGGGDTTALETIAARTGGTFTKME